MSNFAYERLAVTMNSCSNYLQFTLAHGRFRSFRLHLGEEEVEDENGDAHIFDLVWFKDTEELVAVEVEEMLGVILPLNFRLKRNTDRYLFLGQFTEEGVDDLLVHRGRIIEYLWELHTSHLARPLELKPSLL